MSTTMIGGERRWREAEELVIEQFRLITTTLLSILLPLSFLLLSRLSSAAFILSLPSLPPENPDYFLLNTIHAIVYAVVSIVTVHTLIHSCLITKIRSSADTNRSIGFYYPRVSIAWVFLLTLQFSVGLGLRVTISKGVNGVVNGNNHNFLTRLLFFFGLHEATIQWYRVIVKTVVESGFGRREEETTVVERVALAASCGALWWWKLRDEIEALVGVTEVKRALMLLLYIDVDLNTSIVDLGTVDFVNWWLYNMIVTIGVVRIIKGCFRVGMILLFEQVRKIPRGLCASHVNDDINHGDDQV
ncbi:PREDICTED: uncharacterized protein LOC104788553 [Camelina sativa]|uniref:Uncharacterized protein LOC104788553 n=1 Tax=Camelina sativa TaxID=90675 RepID=A0ABM0ZA72_CAMSA|nr:PREDICTED: uncharacterized protein LOC104788553 [Camelina sativa]